MINAAVVGLGTWGKTMVESLAGGSDLMRSTPGQAPAARQCSVYRLGHRHRIGRSPAALHAGETGTQGGEGGGAVGCHGMSLPDVR